MDDMESVFKYALKSYGYDEDDTFIKSFMKYLPNLTVFEKGLACSAITLHLKILYELSREQKININDIDQSLHLFIKAIQSIAATRELDTYKDFPDSTHH